MKKVAISLIIVSIIMIGLGICFNFYKNDENNNVVESVNNNEVENINNNEVGFIDLQIGGVEEIVGGSNLLKINDYEILIPKELVKVGYDVSEENNVLTILSKDNKYKFVLVQLTDDYKTPTEKEIVAFYETKEYIELEEALYDDTYSDKLDKISTDYYKKLGYTKKNSPDYAMTTKELNDLVKDFILAGDAISSGRTGLFPGYKYYDNYDWGKKVLYTIPKSYESEIFGLVESEFTACIYTFEYYNSYEIDYNIDLWTL